MRSAYIRLDQLKFHMSYLDYLSALDVVHWVPRAHDSITEDTVDQAREPRMDNSLSDGGSPEELKSKRQSITPALSSVKLVADPKSVLNQSSQPVASLDSGTNSLAKHAAAKQSKTQTTQDSNFREEAINQCYLVGTNSQQWSPGGLWILCRHQSGQPPESFSNRSGLSKTVKNLLAALNWLVVEADDMNEYSMPPIMTAQLTSTALSDNAMSLSEMLDRHRPKAMLLMGEATANHMMMTERDLSEWSLKRWAHESGVPFIVCHHPFQLYSDPLLKKQVLPQLLQLRQLLIECND